jgi:aconitate hydratase
LFSIKILVENLLRKLDGRVVKADDLKAIANWQPGYDAPVEIPYHPARVLMQDFTGVPAVVDLAAMRDAVKELGGDPRKINPLVPTELIVDHSIQVDYYGTPDCLTQNVAKEYERNGERYKLLKWAQKSFDNFAVVPPNSGICHQVNLEYLGRVVIAEETADGTIAYPDTLVGTDSHTTMINGIGVMGWGVGGIEAEAVMLGQPYYMSIPQVVGVKLSGALNKGVTATDLVLTITELLRNTGVVEKFVEFYGPGLKNLTLTDRATISNMSPEYGATMGIFPVDQKTLDYMVMTNRADRADRTEAYMKANGMFYSEESEAQYSQVVELDLATVVPSLAGPARPQDRIRLNDMKDAFAEILGCDYDRDAEVANISTFLDESGCRTKRKRKCTPVSQRSFTIEVNGTQTSIGDGNVVVAAITSCTNTSNPHVLLGAGLLAKNAVARGLKVPPFVKTSLAPGSRVVIDYLQDAGLMPALEALGFHLAAFGCTTCIGNSGPWTPPSKKPSKTTTSTWPRCSRATAISKPASTRASSPTSWPLPCWWWPTPWPAGWTPTSASNRWAWTPTANRSTWPTSGPRTKRSPPWSKSTSNRSSTRPSTAASSTATNSGTPWISKKAPLTPGIRRPPTSKNRPTSTASTWRPPPPATSKTPALFTSG